MRGLVASLIRFDLRRSFRRVVWVGPPPALPPGPVVAYANHQSFHDGHLLWLLTIHLLERGFLVWMEEGDRVPFFAAQGAMPFPRDDATRRAATMRRTRRLLAERPGMVLAYFPEGTLHGADEPIRPFDPVLLERLHRVLGEPTWWPVAVHLTWRGESRPTALITGGAPASGPAGNAREELRDLRERLRAASGGMVLLDGRTRRHEGWDLTWMRRLFPHRPGGGRTG